MAQEEENDAESSEVADKRVRLDLEVEASGFGRAMQRDLEDVGLCAARVIKILIQGQPNST
jgi:hypothetical protein